MSPASIRRPACPVSTRRWVASLLLTLVTVASALTLVFLPLPTAQAESGTVQEMTFLLHSVNATETAKSLPDGGSTLTYFDTTLAFNDQNVSVLVEGPQKVLKWYLSPALAGDFATDRFTLRIWANSSTGASSSAQVSIELFQVTDTAPPLKIAERNFGSQDFSVTLELKTWSHAFTAHTFSAGSSIELRMTVTPGANQGVWFHYDTPQMNSRLSLRSPNSLDVAAIAVLDADGNLTLNFEPGAATKDVTFRANVTSPFGGYDIVWVNLTLISPFDTVILDNVSMAHVEGTPISFESVFELAWNYSDQPNGQYTVVVWALDRNGHNHNHFFQQFTYDPYPDIGETTFSIGGLPFYVNVRTMDAAGEVLPSATVLLVTAGFPVGQNVTDATGLANLSMTGDTYEFRVLWQDVVVAQVVYEVQANVSVSDPLVLTTQVYSPVFQAETAEGSALPGATFLLGHPNGDTLGPLKTDANGRLVLERVPVGNYSLEVSWRGINVFSGFQVVEANGVIAVSTAVYELRVTARSAVGEPLPGAFVSVSDATGLVFDAGVTEADGIAVLLLPQGSYEVHVRYVTTHMGSLYDAEQTATVDLTASQEVAVTFGDFPVPLIQTGFFLFGLVYGATLAVLVGAFLWLRRRGRGPDGGREEDDFPSP